MDFCRRTNWLREGAKGATMQGKEKTDIRDKEGGSVFFIGDTQLKTTGGIKRISHTKRGRGTRRVKGYGDVAGGEGAFRKWDKCLLRRVPESTDYRPIEKKQIHQSRNGNR